jgi:hypothetical protein
MAISTFPYTCTGARIYADDPCLATAKADRYLVDHQAKASPSINPAHHWLRSTTPTEVHSDPRCSDLHMTLQHPMHPDDTTHVPPCRSFRLYTQEPKVARRTKDLTKGRLRRPVGIPGLPHTLHHAEQVASEIIDDASNGVREPGLKGTSANRTGHQRILDPQSVCPPGCVTAATQFHELSPVLL